MVLRSDTTDVCPKDASTLPGVHVLLRKLETNHGVHPASQRWLIELQTEDGVPQQMATYDPDQITGACLSSSASCAPKFTLLTYTLLLNNNVAV